MTEHNLPWSYRPHEFDDWGWIRNADGTLIATARSEEYQTRESFDEHRRNGTDPYEKTARLIIEAVNRSGGNAQASPSRKQIEAVIDDYLGNIDATYEDSRQRCAQAIVDLYAVTSTTRATPRLCSCKASSRDGQHMGLVSGGFLHSPQPAKESRPMSELPRSPMRCPCGNPARGGSVTCGIVICLANDAHERARLAINRRRNPPDRDAAEAADDGRDAGAMLPAAAAE